MPESEPPNRSAGRGSLPEGSVLGGDFVLETVLGRGGMGEVYRATQISTGKARAVKVLHPLVVSEAGARERFEREARVAANIASDHIVEVIGAGVDDDGPWLAMELLEGETLAERLLDGGLDRATAVDVLEQLAHGLGAAHEAGLVHRDIKPENIFLATARRAGVPFTLKILDFGVAKVLASASGGSTTSGVGTPLWMAPEQTDSGRVRPATDVWAFGLLAFQLFAGRPYWKTANRPGGTIQGLLVEIMVEPLTAATERAAELEGGAVPQGFDDWFARCVVRDPEQRYATASEAMAALRPLLTGAVGSEPVDPLSATMPTPLTRPTIDTPLNSPTDGLEASSSSGSGRWLGLGLVTALLVVAVVAVVAVVLSPRTPPAEVEAVGGPAAVSAAALGAPATVEAGTEDGGAEDASGPETAPAAVQIDPAESDLRDPDPVPIDSNAESSSSGRVREDERRPAERRRARPTVGPDGHRVAAPQRLTIDERRQVERFEQVALQRCRDALEGQPRTLAMQVLAQRNGMARAVTFLSPAPEDLQRCVRVWASSHSWVFLGPPTRRSEP